MHKTVLHADSSSVQWGSHGDLGFVIPQRRRLDRLVWKPLCRLAEMLVGPQQLVKKRLDKLLDYAIVNNVDIQAAASGFVYLQDWDLGDLVDVIVADIGLAMQARIVTVREVFKQNNHTVEIELGDKKLTQLQKARMIY